MLAVMAYDDSMYSVVHDQTLYGTSVLMNDFDSGMMMMMLSSSFSSSCLRVGLTSSLGGARRAPVAYVLKREANRRG